MANSARSRLPHPSAAWAALIGALSLLALLPSAVQADGAYPGTYAGKTKGGKASVAVSSSQRAKLRYSFSSGCGRVRGSMQLGTLDERSLSAKGKASVAGDKVKAGFKGKIAARGGSLAGTLKAKPDGKCRAAKQRLVLRLADGGGLEGQYVGTTNEGLPFSLSVGTDPAQGTPVVEDVAWQVNLICVSIFDDELEPAIVGKVSGLAGKVEPPGEFDLAVYYEGDPEADLDDVDYDASGELDGTSAEGDLTVSDARFDPTGILAPLAELQCEEATEDWVTFTAEPG